MSQQERVEIRVHVMRDYEGKITGKGGSNVRISVLQSLNDMTPRKRERPGGHMQLGWESVEMGERLGLISMRDSESNREDNGQQTCIRDAMPEVHDIKKRVQETEGERSED